MNPIGIENHIRALEATGLEFHADSVRPTQKAESTVSQADITPEQALDKLIFPEHEPNLEAVFCPDCAEKDAKIATLKAQLERHIQTGIDLIKLNEESRQANGKIFSELHAKLEIAKNALRSISRLMPGFEFAASSIAGAPGIAEEALKQIGE